MIDTIIFDMDGTLLNTLDDLTDSVNFAMEQMGVPLHTADEVRMMVGNSAHHLIKCALPDGAGEDEITRCLEIFEKHYHGNLRNKTAPYDGIVDMLGKVKAAGYKLAVVSNKSDGFTKELTRDFFGEFISTAIGRSEKFPRKPAPDSVWHAMELLGSTRETTVYVGDSEVDCITARNAGLPCIGCLWGFRDRVTLETEGVTAVISHPNELVDAIASINSKE